MIKLEKSQACGLRFDPFHQIGMLTAHVLREALIVGSKTAGINTLQKTHKVLNKVGLNQVNRQQKEDPYHVFSNLF